MSKQWDERTGEWREWVAEDVVKAMNLEVKERVFEAFVQLPPANGPKKDGCHVIGHQPLYGFTIGNKAMTDRYLKMQKKWHDKYIMKRKDGVQVYYGPIFMGEQE